MTPYYSVLRRQLDAARLIAKAGKEDHDPYSDHPDAQVCSDMESIEKILTALLAEIN